MNINIQSVLQQVISSAKRAIEDKAISLSCEVDSAIPHCLIGKQLLLTHVLHGLINEALAHIIKGKITVKAKLLSTEKQDIVIRFLVAYSASKPVSGSKIKSDVADTIQLKKLIQKQGGSFEEATAPGLGKQYAFSLSYQYKEAMAPVLSREYSFIDALWVLGKMFSHASLNKAVN